jgi:hypothetical protein
MVALVVKHGNEELFDVDLVSSSQDAFFDIHRGRIDGMNRREEGSHL